MASPFPPTASSHYMYNWEFCQGGVRDVGRGCSLNNCGKCGRYYGYNRRKVKAQDKAMCGHCDADNIGYGSNGVRCYGKRTQMGDTADFPTKATSEDVFYGEKRLSDVTTFHDGSDAGGPENGDGPTTVVGPSSEALVKINSGLQQFTDQLLHRIKLEFAYELQNPEKALRMDFEWPTTDQLSKVDCLRAFNIMKQTLLHEMSKGDDLVGPNSLAVRRKFYFERLMRSLDREKIRRLKVYESFYKHDEIMAGLSS